MRQGCRREGGRHKSAPAVTAKPATRACHGTAIAETAAVNRTIMAVKVRIPTPLRKLTHEQELVEVASGTIGSALAELQRSFPGIQERLVDESGQVRRFVNVYVNEEDIRFLQNNDTPIKDGDEISIIPAIAGG